MSRLPVHPERHAMDRIGWLRAAVLGANDGIVSTSSLIVGIAAASAGHSAVLTAGIAGLLAGALSMAAGEYVSVSSQADTEQADLARERRELAEQPADELDELTMIYVGRGLSPGLARQVAEELTAGDALAAHSRDELGIVGHLAANPLQAAVTSAITFAVGAAVPLLAVVLTPPSAERPHRGRRDGQAGAARRDLGRTRHGDHLRRRLAVRPGRRLGLESANPPLSRNPPRAASCRAAWRGG